MLKKIALTAFALAMSCNVASAELTLEGPCSDGTRWTARLLNQGAGGEALLRMCNQPFLASATFTCSPPNNSVRAHLTLVLTDVARDGEQLTGVIRVDGRDYPVRGRAEPLDFDNGLNPVLAISKTDPVFRAMMNGTRAQAILKGRTFDMHLRGSSDAIGGMLEGCGVF